MENKLQLFTFEGQDVRAVWIEDEAWYILVDVCKILGLGDPSRLADRLGTDGTTFSRVIDSMGRSQEMLCVNLPNYLRAIMRSNKPDALRFQKWVCGEVLPAILKTGSYSMGSQTAKEQLQNELTMLQFVQNAVDRISQAIAQPWIVEDKERVFYGKSAMDHLRLEVGRANKGYTEVAKYFHGKNVFDGFDARGRLAKFQMDIHNGRVTETQMQMPFGNNQ